MKPDQHSQPKESTVFQQQVEELVSLDRLKNQNDKSDQDISRLEAVKHQDESEHLDPLTKIRLDIEKVKKNHEKQLAAMMAMLQQREAEIKSIQTTEAKTD